MEMMSEHLSLFYKALSACDDLIASNPGNLTLMSIRRQLNFLIGLEQGYETDRTKLLTIIIGRQTAMDVEKINMEVADIFYDVAAVVDQMVDK